MIFMCIIGILVFGLICYLIGYTSGYMRNYHEIIRLEEEILSMQFLYEMQEVSKRKNRHESCKEMS